MIIGTCMSNGLGDVIGANKLNSQCYRLTVQQALEMPDIDQPYILLMGGASSDNDFVSLSESILQAWDKLKRKPVMILCQNEQNEISYLLPKYVKEYVVNKINVPIIKGPFTCCVERAGQKAYEEMKGWNSPLVEAVNYYEVPSWESFAWLKNLKRRYRFKRLVKKLNKLSVLGIIVTEFHAGSRTRPGFDDVHGDYLYHSKKDFDRIVKFLNGCGVDIALYYQAAFLGRNGNDVV